MPKQKSHKGLRKRFKLTARGKVKYRHSFGSHIMRTKNAKRRRRISSPTIMTGAIAEKVKAKLGV